MTYTETDEAGTWECIRYDNGVIERHLLQPSPAYEAKRKASHDAILAAIGAVDEVQE